MNIATPPFLNVYRERTGRRVTRHSVAGSPKTVTVLGNSVAVSVNDRLAVYRLR